MIWGIPELAPFLGYFWGPPCVLKFMLNRILTPLTNIQVMAKKILGTQSRFEVQWLFKYTVT